MKLVFCVKKKTNSFCTKYKIHSFNLFSSQFQVEYPQDGQILTAHKLNNSPIVEMLNFQLSNPLPLPFAKFKVQNYYCNFSYLFLS